jgi:hypothetical protein
LPEPFDDLDQAAQRSSNLTSDPWIVRFARFYLTRSQDNSEQSIPPVDGSGRRRRDEVGERRRSLRLRQDGAE